MNVLILLVCHLFPSAELKRGKKMHLIASYQSMTQESQGVLLYSYILTRTLSMLDFLEMQDVKETWLGKAVICYICKFRCEIFELPFNGLLPLIAHSYCSLEGLLEL